MAPPPPPPYTCLTKLFNVLTRPKSRNPQRLLQSRWIAASHGACTCLDWGERVVEGEVQNVKRSTFLPTYRPRHCSLNPPRDPTARTHPKPTHTYHICQDAREKGRPSNNQQSQVWSSGTAAVGSFVGKGSNGGPLGVLGMGIYQRQSHFSQLWQGEAIPWANF